MAMKIELLESINPSNECVISKYYVANKNDVADAVKSARRAFDPWRKVSRVKRAEYFDDLCQEMKEKKEDIAEAITLETGKSLSESRAEVIESLHMAQYCFGKGREPYGEVIASEMSERDCYTIRKPKGVVAVISPWNFPFNIGGFWGAAPAILEGNTVVMKPSELAPGVGELVRDLYRNFPKGVFNLIQGDGKVGEFLVNDEVDHIIFTGSPEVGKTIRKACAESWHKTCSCEMGSKSAVIVFSDCDIDLAVSAAVNSAMKTSGQRCVSAGRILVQRDIIDSFVPKFLEKIDKFSPSDPDNYYGPIISKKQMERVMSFNEMVANDTDAKVYRKGERIESPGYFLSPTVYQCEWDDKPYLKKEVFGPHVAIVPFSDTRDAIEIYNDTKFGLSVAVITNDYRKMREMRDNCDAGMIYFNLACVGAESSAPFGGVKASGNGSPTAAAMFDAVIHKVTVSVNHSSSINFPQGLK